MSLIKKLSESLKKLSEDKRVRKAVIRDGKRVMITKTEYSRPTPKGWKRLNGKLVKMSREEIMNRSRAARVAARNPATRRKRQISMRRRKSIIK